jgi:hypothetical protein
VGGIIAGLWEQSSTIEFLCYKNKKRPKLNGFVLFVPSVVDWNNPAVAQPGRIGSRLILEKSGLRGCVKLSCKKVAKNPLFLGAPRTFYSIPLCIPEQSKTRKLKTSLKRGGGTLAITEW